MSERLPRPDDMKPDAYQRNLAARAFDVARYLLFWGMPTNVGQVTSIRTLEKQIRRLKASEYAELRELGDEIAQACAAEPDCAWDAERASRAARAHARAPRRAGRARRAVARRSRAVGRAESAAARRRASRTASICSGPRNVPADIAATLLYPVTDRPFRELYEMACGWSDRQRAEVIDVALASRTRRDEILAGFRGGLYAYDIVMDIGAYRDLHRHRRCQKFRQAYSGNLGYDTPKLVAECRRRRDLRARRCRPRSTPCAACRARRALPAAVRRALALPVQDGFRRGRVHLAPAQRREGPLQLPRDRLGDEVQDGAAGAGAGPADRGHAAVGGRSAEAVTATLAARRGVTMHFDPKNITARGHRRLRTDRA